MVSTNGKLDKSKFTQAYQLSDVLCDKFLSEADFEEDANMDEYEFVCMVHSLCSRTIEELGSMFFKILTKNKTDLNEKNLLPFTRMCLLYNAYLNKTEINESDITK
jgi:hypothetical protein